MTERGDPLTAGLDKIVAQLEGRLAAACAQQKRLMEQNDKTIAALAEENAQLKARVAELVQREVDRLETDFRHRPDQSRP